MGCDIHLYFEKKNKNGKWEKIDVDKKIVPNERCYSLFAQLADVRNFGDEEVVPWFPRRGIPDDTSLPGTETDDIWLGDHSFTYATLAEILSAPWDKTDGLENEYFYIFCWYVLPRLCSFTAWLNKEEKENIRVLMGFDN